jgi:hypothetical protein
MKNLLFHLKAVKTATHKVEVGAEPALEPKQIVSAPQHWYRVQCMSTGYRVQGT